MSTEMQHKYAVCRTCGVDLPSPEAKRQHMDETLAASKDRRSHSTSVVNPTPEEQAANDRRWRVTSAVDDAINEFISEMEQAIYQGKMTEEQITAELSGHPDFGDAWFNYLAEDQR